LTEVQGASIRNGWTPPSGPLGSLIAAAAQRVAVLRQGAAALEATSAPSGVKEFSAGLRGPDVAIIAELKRRSPSRGSINEALDVSARAREYAGAGAAALSVLTEPDQFGGSLDDLRVARRATDLPLLRKDFIIDRLQVLEARAAGAAAILIIARALPPASFISLAGAGRTLGLDVLLEVRDERELELALEVDGGVIGINNRDLETLAVDDRVSARLLPLIPATRLAVYESGVRDRAGVERAAGLGADAVLVGSSLSMSLDGGAAVAALTGVPRRPRDR
jgi:indole-3-glycerol phosphate synthase